MKIQEYVDEKRKKELIMNKEEYLERHINKALNDMRKVVFPGHLKSVFEKSFINKADVDFKIENTADCLGYFSRENKPTIVVSSRYFTKINNRYNKDLLAVLRHEILHYYIYKHIESKHTVIKNLSTDNSIIHTALCKWFTNKGLITVSNGTLDNFNNIFNGWIDTELDNKFRRFVFLLEENLYKVEKELTEYKNRLAKDGIYIDFIISNEHEYSLIKKFSDTTYVVCLGADWTLEQTNEYSITERTDEYCGIAKTINDCIEYQELNIPKMA